MNAPERARLTGVESAGTVVYAAGERGLLLERAAPAEWTAIRTDGPDGDGRNNRDLALTDDGERVWVVGDAGTLARYDRATGAVHTHDRPYGITAGFRSVSVTGAAGEESLYVADTDGEVVRATADGDDLTVGRVSVPGDGTALTEVEATDAGLFVADASGTVFHSTDGRRWRRRRLADAPARALAVDGDSAYEVAADGAVFEAREGRSAAASSFSPSASTPTLRTTDSGVVAPTELAAADGVVAVSGGGGQLAVSEGGAPFARVDAGTDRALYGLELLDSGTLIGVGTAGAVVEGVPGRGE